MPHAGYATAPATAGRGAGLLAAVLALVAGPVAAQVPDTTLRQYDLAEVVVQETGEAATRTASVQRLGVADLARLTPATAADVVRLIPGAHVQVNSRGEALVYVRGAAERQVALFLDGVPLNVPWDARFDLSFVPSAFIGSLETARGPFSVLYGPNAAGGALDVRTKSLGSRGTLVEGELSGGLPERAGASLVVHRHTPRLLVDAGVAGLTRTADAHSHEADVPFSEDGGRQRVNTDRRQGGAFARAGATLPGGGRVGLTALYLEGRKGIAPESHLDPARESIRYWRYPLMRMALVTATGEQTLAGGALVRAQVWTQHYAQHIDQYASVQYDAREAGQRDGDYTHGARLSARVARGGTTLRASLLGYTSLHRQVDVEGGVDGALQRYRQHTGSAGLELVQDAGAWTFRAGGALDAFAAPLTADKPPYDPLRAWSGAAGASWRPASGVTLHAGTARKTRFPTLRELFGTALKRFLLNPDLRPETVWASEAGGTWRLGDARLDLTGFHQRTADAIDQRTVVVDGRSLRQRVNLDGSRVYGVEAAALWLPLPAVRAEGHLTVLRARGLEAGRTVPLVEKPSVIGFASVEARAAQGFRAAVDVTHLAGAYAVERDGDFPRLPAVWLWSVKATQVLPVSHAAVQLFARVDNVFDALQLPQEGLPAAGRTVTFGVAVQR